MKRILGLAALAALTLGFGPAAQATVLSFEAFLDGPSESPSNASPGTGYATLVLDDVGNTMALHVEFSDLIGTTTAAHIHAPTGPRERVPPASPPRRPRSSVSRSG